MRSRLGQTPSQGSGVLNCRGAPSSGSTAALHVCVAFWGVSSTRGHPEVNDHCGKNQRAPKQYNKWHAVRAISATIVYRNNSIRICCACYDRRWAQIVGSVNRIKAHSKQGCGYFHTSSLTIVKQVNSCGQTLMNKYFGTDKGRTPHCRIIWQRLPLKACYLCHDEELIT